MNKVNSEKNVETKGIVSIELSKIVTGAFNPRKSISESGLMELADSIKQVGLLQPVLVRPKGKKFEIVCGERKFRASVLADTKTIPAIVRKMSDDEALEAAITENLCRVDVFLIEESVASTNVLRIPDVTVWKTLPSVSGKAKHTSVTGCA